MNRVGIRSFFILALFLVLAGLGLFYWEKASREAKSTHSQELAPAVGQNATAPNEVVDFELRDAKGRMIRLSQFKGKLILLNFWASWCPPCIEEMPAMLKFATVAKARWGVETVTVSVDESWKIVRELFDMGPGFHKDNGKRWAFKDVPFHILLDAEQKASSTYSATKFPETFVISKDFKIVRRFVGAQNWMSQELITWFENLASQQ